MPKYYVSSGRLQTIISRTSPRAAAVDAIARDIRGGGNPVSYGSITEVNETGHTYNPEEGVFFSTPALISRASTTL